MESNLPLVKQLTSASIDHINNVKLKDHKHLCLPLEVQQIIRAEVEELPIPKNLKTKTVPQANFTHSYTVLFEVAPSGGIFESRILYNRATERVQVNNDILRINLYGQTSACIQDKYELRSFCYCISYHKNLTNNGITTMGSSLASNSTAKTRMIIRKNAIWMNPSLAFYRLISSKSIAGDRLPVFFPSVIDRIKEHSEIAIVDFDAQVGMRKDTLSCTIG